jgi:hypothetical protein
LPDIHYYFFWALIVGLVLGSNMVYQKRNQRILESNHKYQQETEALIADVLAKSEAQRAQERERYELDRALYRETLLKLTEVAQQAHSPIPQQSVDFMMEMSRFSMQALHSMAFSAQEKLTAFADRSIQSQVAAQMMRARQVPAPPRQDAEDPLPNNPTYPVGDGFRKQPVAEAPVDTISYGDNPEEAFRPHIPPEYRDIISEEDMERLREDLDEIRKTPPPNA